MILSIITPCYNSEEFIEEAICSVISQNNKNIELILIDDGSIDNTEEICKKYVSENIHYKKIENSGAGYARNIGIEQANGQWITFLDSDDLYLTNSFNDKVIEVLNQYREQNVDIIYTPRIKIDMNLNETPQITYPEEVDSIQNYMPKLEFWTCIYNSKFIKNNKIKFYEYRKQDIESAFRFLAFSNAKKVIKNDKLKFYLQRNNLNSNTHTWNLYNLYEVKAKVFYDLYIKSLNKNLEVKKSLLELIITCIYKFYILCLKKGYFSDKNQLEDMHLLLKNISKCNEINLLNKDIKTQLNRIMLMDKFYKIIFIRKNISKIEVNNCNESKNKSRRDIYDIQNKLNKVADQILSL